MSQAEFYLFLVGLALMVVTPAATALAQSRAEWKGLLGVLASLVIAVTVLSPFVAAPIWFVVDQLELDDVRLKQAIIGAIVVAAGWVVGFLTQELRRLQDRNERRRDLIKALTTEIGALVNYNPKERWLTAIKNAAKPFDTEVKEQKRNASYPAYLPYVRYVHKMTVLRRVIDEIEVLEGRHIQKVYEFYNLIDRIQQMAENLESEAYKSLDAERRKAAYIALLNVHAEVEDAGKEALRTFGIDWEKEFKPRSVDA